MSSIDDNTFYKTNNRDQSESINIDLLKQVSSTQVNFATKNDDIMLNQINTNPSKNAYNTVESLHLQLDKFLDANNGKENNEEMSSGTGSTLGSSTQNKVFLESLNEV